MNGILPLISISGDLTNYASAHPEIKPEYLTVPFIILCVGIGVALLSVIYMALTPIYSKGKASPVKVITAIFSSINLILGVLLLLLYGVVITLLLVRSYDYTIEIINDFENIVFAVCLAPANFGMPIDWSASSIEIETHLPLIFYGLFLGVPAVLSIISFAVSAHARKKHKNARSASNTAQAIAAQIGTMGGANHPVQPQYNGQPPMQQPYNGQPPVQPQYNGQPQVQPQYNAQPSVQQPYNPQPPVQQPFAPQPPVQPQGAAQQSEFSNPAETAAPVMAGAAAAAAAAEPTPAQPEPEQPAATPDVQPEPEQPAAIPDVQPELEQPAAAPDAQPEPEQPAAAPDAQPEPEQPAAIPDAQPEPEQPAAVPDAQPEPEQPAPAVSRCSNCGSILDGAAFCSFCGTPAGTAPSNPAKCPACGADVKEGYAFCAVCGRKL